MKPTRIRPAPIRVKVLVVQIIDYISLKLAYFFAEESFGTAQN